MLFSRTAGWLLVGTLVWWAAMAHQRTCETTVAGEQVNAMLRLCYSDLPITFQNQLATGHSPYVATPPVDQPPLVALLMTVLRLFVAVAHPVHDGVTPQQALDGGNLFLVLAAVVFGVCWLVLLRTVLALLTRATTPDTRTPGTTTPDTTTPDTGARPHPWTLAALSLTTFTAALISWEMVGATLLVTALWAWHTRRWLACGVLAGLAGLASGFLLPLIAVLAVLALVEILRGRADWPRFGQTAGVAAALVFVGNLLVILTAFTGWKQWVTAQLRPDLGLGSLWQHVLPEGGPTSVLVARLVVVFTTLLVAALLGLALLGRLEPRPEQLMLVVVGLTTVLAPTHSPQQALLWVPLVALCRPPRWVALAAASEALYWGAVWAYLNGSLRFGERDGTTPYALAIVVRITVVLITCLSVLVEVWRDLPEPHPRPMTSRAGEAA